MFIDDNPILTIATLRARARRLQRLYGIDLIMELEGTIYLIQVKSKADAAKRSINNRYYRYIDIFAGQTPDQNGIMLYDRDEMQGGEFIGKDILKENLDYLINKFYDTGDVNLD